MVSLSKRITLAAGNSLWHSVSTVSVPMPENLILVLEQLGHFFIME